MTYRISAQVLAELHKLQQALALHVISSLLLLHHRILDRQLLRRRRIHLVLLLLLLLCRSLRLRLRLSLWLRLGLRLGLGGCLGDLRLAMAGRHLVWLGRSRVGCLGWSLGTSGSWGAGLR